MRTRRMREVTFHVPPRVSSRAVALGLFVILESAGIAGQVAGGGQPEALSFEVASVRRNNAAAVSLVGVQTHPGGSVVGTNVQLRALIYFAYGLKTHETIEGKSDLVTQRFDVIAKAPADVPSVPSGQVGPLNLMMQDLLAKRFKLVVRVEDRPQQGYALVPARADGRLGPGLRPAERCGLPRGPAGEKVICAISVVNNLLSGDGQDMGRLAGMLSLSVGRTVVDKTGILETFDVRMTFDQRALREATGQPVMPSDTPSTLPSFFTALQEQLGLKLEPHRVPARAFIVEHVEPPSEN